MISIFKNLLKAVRPSVVVAFSYGLFGADHIDIIKKERFVKELNDLKISNHIIMDCAYKYETIIAEFSKKDQSEKDFTLAKQLFNSMSEINDNGRIIYLTIESKILAYYGKFLNNIN